MFQPIHMNQLLEFGNGLPSMVQKYIHLLFFSDGRYSYTDTSATNISLGTWSKIRENEYNVTYSNGKIQTFVHNRTTDTFTMPDFSQVRIYRLGKESLATILTIVPTPVPNLYLTGKIGDCLSEPKNRVYQLCLDKDVNVGIKNNKLIATGILFYKSLSRQTTYWDDFAYEGNEVNASVNLKIYNNKSVKVAEVSKTFTVDKNGKTLIELNTEISENDPIDWTYLVSVEKNQDAITSVTTNPTLRTQTGTICKIISNQGYRYGSMWTVYGYASNIGTASGTCVVLVELIASNGESLNSQSQPVFISSGGIESFSITVEAPNNAGRYRISISDKK
jgi:hypothetical protein